MTGKSAVRRGGFLLTLTLVASASAPAQERKTASRIDVQHYVIEAEVNPRTQSLNASVQVQYIATDD